MKYILPTQYCNIECFFTSCEYKLKKLKLMKKLVIILLCTVATLSVSAQKKKTVKAEGPVVKKEVKIGNFEGVHTSCAIDVYLVQGNSNSLSIETEKNLHDYIKAEVKDNVLHLYTKANIKGTKGMKAYVSMSEIVSLKASSAGDIHGESAIKADEIKLSASSAGDIKLKLKADKVYVNCSSAGDIKLVGNAKYLKASASSSGDLYAADFEVKEAKVSASSSGDVVVNVQDNLYARASSTGDVRYIGDPEVDAKTSSLGSIKKK